MNPPSCFDFSLSMYNPQLQEKKKKKQHRMKPVFCKQNDCCLIVIEADC